MDKLFLDSNVLAALGIQALRNRYLGLRHGFSEANVIELVASYPDHAIDKWGLSDLGKSQVTSSVKKEVQRGIITSKTIIHSSDFLRARESAEIVRQISGVKEIILEAALRDRNFGSLEMKEVEDDVYKQMWLADAADATSEKWGVESAAHVMERVARLMVRLEEKYDRQTILLVSHGDPLQMLECALSGLPASRHQEIKPFHQAEIRELVLSPSDESLLEPIDYEAEIASRRITHQPIEEASGEMKNSVFGV